MKKVKHCAIALKNLNKKIEFWIQTDRLFDKNSDDLFMHEFIFLNKKDMNWRRSIFVVYRFETISEYEKECMVKQIKNGFDMDEFELERVD